MIAPLKALRAGISTSTMLAVFWQQHYQKDAKHFIGYKRSPNANDYPSLCYVPVKSQLGQQPFDEYDVSLVVAVQEPGMTDDIFDGVQRLSDFVDLLVPVLQAGNPNWTVKNGEVMVTTDLGMRHPFYEMEIQFKLLVEPAQISAAQLAAMGDFNTLASNFDIGDIESPVEHALWLHEPPVLTNSQPLLIDDLELPQT